tara:strand:- start:415 stop:828 length:414 start_codon:yes stop_codon:yes gene_type:complete
MLNYTPDEYKERLNNVSISYFSLLNKDYYDDDYENNETYKHNLATIGDDFFHIKESIFKDIEELLCGIQVNDDKIKQYNSENGELRKKYMELRDKIDGAKGMQSDIQTRYNQSYYGNILIVISIIGGFVFYTRTRNL